MKFKIYLAISILIGLSSGAPDFGAPSPIADDDTDDFKLPDDGGDTTPTYTGPGGQDTPPLPSTPNRTGERKPNTAEFQREQSSISEYLTKLARQDQLNPVSVTEDSGPNYKAWSIAISPVAAAGLSATVEVGLAVDTSGQVLLFSSHCSGLKMDVSIEADIAVGHWFRLDDVIGPTFTLGVGVDLLEVPASARERGANSKLVFNSVGNLIGTTISVGVGKGPILPIDYEANFDICETSELYRFNLI